MTVSITFGSGITIGQGITAGAAGGGGGGPTTPTGTPTSTNYAYRTFEMGLWTSGTTVPDISGLNNTFTLSNASAGNSQYYHFNGSTYATADSTGFPTAGSSAMTIIGWFSLPSFGSTTLVSRNNGGQGWALRIDAGGSQINLVKYNVADQNVSISTLTTNDWHFIAVSQNGSNLTYVVDGSVYTTTGSSTPFAGSGIPVRLAYDDYTSGVQAEQYMREVRIIDSEINSSTLTGLWNSQKASYGY